jgi:hypothetical protein
MSPPGGGVGFAAGLGGIGAARGGGGAGASAVGGENQPRIRGPGSLAVSTTGWGTPNTWSMPCKLIWWPQTRHFFLARWRRCRGREAGLGAKAHDGKQSWESKLAIGQRGDSTTNSSNGRSKTHGSRPWKLGSKAMRMRCATTSAPGPTCVANRMSACCSRRRNGADPKDRD